MQQAAPNSDCPAADPFLAARTAEPDAIAPAFANFLNALTRPGEEPLPSCIEAELAEDVATLSYERALQASARYRSRQSDDRSLTEPMVPRSAAGQGATAWPQRKGETASAQAGLKSASVTIRMSQAESEQLRRRANEAGLTVSAYLRSCTFEVESLRAQVKDALTQLRPVPPPESAGDLSPSRPSWIRRVIGR